MTILFSETVYERAPAEEMPDIGWCTVQEAARRADCSESYISRLLNRERLAGFHMGRFWCVYTDDLEWMIKKRDTEAAVAELGRCLKIGKSKVATVTRPDLHCPRCGDETDRGEMCQVCQRKFRGEPYWMVRDDPLWSPRLEARLCV
jgi:excisionase family DNA binding protein